MKDNPIKENNNYLVSQRNSLVEADYSKTKLPAKTLKVGRLIVSKISPDDKNFRLTKIKNSAIRQYLGYKSNVPYNRFNADLEDICKRLNEQLIKIKTDRGTTINAFLISSWETDYKEDVTIFEISGRLKQYLLELKESYTSYQLSNIPRLNSSYSIRIYELLCQYRKLGKRKFEVEDLKRKIGCNYRLYGHFKDKALLRAQSNLEEFTDIRFDFEEIKKGRKIVELLFYIYPNIPKEESKHGTQGVLDFLDGAIEVQEKPTLSKNLITTLSKLGLSQKNITAYLTKGFAIIEDEDKRTKALKRCRNIQTYFLEKITLYEQSKSQNSNPAGFLIKALKEDWVSPKLFREQKNKNSLTKRKKLKQEVLLLEKKLEVLNHKFSQIRKPILTRLLNDEDKFSKAFEAVKKYQENIKFKFIDSRLSPLKNYQDSAFMKSYIDTEFEKSYPKLFVESKKISIEIEELTKNIEELKKKNYL